MSDRYFDNWEELVSAADKKIPVILKKYVSGVAQSILKSHIKSDIYDVYTPKDGAWVNGTTYQRRHVLEDSISSIYPDSHTLLVTSTATASPSILHGYSFRNRYPGAFLRLLESGNMGIWKNGFPRPAVSLTQDEIDESQDIIDSINEGIKREIEIS